MIPDSSEDKISGTVEVERMPSEKASKKVLTFNQYSNFIHSDVISADSDINNFCSVKRNQLQEEMPSQPEVRQPLKKNLIRLFLSHQARADMVGRRLKNDGDKGLDMPPSPLPTAFLGTSVSTKTKV